MADSADDKTAAAQKDVERIELWKRVWIGLFVAYLVFAGLSIPAVGVVSLRAFELFSLFGIGAVTFITQIETVAGRKKSAEAKVAGYDNP